LPAKTNFIVVANHTSYLDPFVVGVAIPKKIYWLALRGLYVSRWTRWFMLGTNTLPAGRSSDIFVTLLLNNKVVGLFPEGKRSPDGNMAEFRRGAAMLAMKTGRPIVPCAIMGTYEALPVKSKFPHLYSRITIRIGKPIFLLKEYEDIIDDVYMQEGLLKVKNTIREMLYA